MSEPAGTPPAPTTRTESVPGVVVRALGHPRVALAALGFVRTVLVDFFALQFSVKLGLRKVTISHVDHPLDEQIPFTPSRIGTYLDFIAYWIRPLGWIARRFGLGAFVRYGVEYLRLIDRCYREAAEVYSAGMTTTRRPRYLKGRFLAIHLFDPHLLCVPSLHVMICVLTYTFHRRALRELGASPAEAETLDAELYDAAVDITESVLLIKQHSVNCLPAALYAMTRITPADVTPAVADHFTARLFAGDALPAASAIRDHVAQTYARLVEEGASEPWTATIQRFVRELSGAAAS